MQFTLCKKYGKIEASSPHNPIKKRSAVAIEHPDNPQKVVVYVKGAPEVIMTSCKYIVTHKGA